MKQNKFCPTCNKSIWADSTFCREHALHPTTFKNGHGLSNTGKTHFKKGHAAWNKGKEGFVDDKHPGWKGDKVGYHGLHSWISRKLGKAWKCVKCDGTRGSKLYQWANLSHDYKRSLLDWTMLCTRCHGEYDSNARRANAN